MKNDDTYDPRSDIEAIIERITDEIELHESRMRTLHSKSESLRRAVERLELTLRDFPDDEEADSPRELPAPRSEESHGDPASEREARDVPGHVETGVPSSGPSEVSQATSQEPGEQETEHPKDDRPLSHPYRVSYDLVRRVRDHIVDELAPKLREDPELFMRSGDRASAGRRPGYFLVQDVSDATGIPKGSVRKATQQLEKMLDRAKYRAGTQMRYREPSEDVKVTHPLVDSHINLAHNVANRPSAVEGTGKKAQRTYNGSNKDIVELLRASKEQGFKVEAMGNGHVRITNRHSGKFVVVTSTPRKLGTVTRHRQELRKIGVKL